MIAITLFFVNEAIYRRVLKILIYSLIAKKKTKPNHPDNKKSNTHTKNLTKI